MKEYNHPLYDTEIRDFSNYLRLKRYSPKTYKMYMGILLKYLYTLDCQLSDVEQSGFEYYLLSHPWSQSHQRQVHGCLGNFFRHVLKRNDVVKFVPFATAESKLPDTYAEEEISLLLQHAGNIKNKLMILLQYDCGLRVGELPAIDLSHVDLFRNVVKIAGAKGKKDRLAPFGTTTRQLLEIYLRTHTPKPTKYLFEGQHRERYATRTIQQVNTDAKAAAGIIKQGCTHILRHSFATHLYEAGLGLEDVGLRLGHAPGSKSTQVYARMSPALMSRQPTPADKLQLNFALPATQLKIA